MTAIKKTQPTRRAARRAADGIDLEHLRAWREGDNDAGGALLERHVATVVEYIRAGHAFDAAQLHEMVQATMLACVESRDRVPDGLAFRVYLLGIARRVVANTYRDEYRRRAREIALLPEPPAQSPGQLVVAREERRRLLNALPELPSDLQVVVRLHYWEHRRTEDIAAACSIPNGTVKSRLRRARERLFAAIHQPRFDHERGHSGFDARQ